MFPSWMSICKWIKELDSHSIQLQADSRTQFALFGASRGSPCIDVFLAPIAERFGR
jgi:hypothetical protein